jgi:hypothetical protein
VSDRLAEIEAARAKRRADSDRARDEQKATDLEAISELEIEHGDTNISTLECPYTPGLPVMLAVRTPKPAEMKRYRDGCKPDKNGRSDALGPAILLAEICRVYPPRDEDGTALYARVCEARPGVNVQLGVLAVKLAAGKAEDEGKG